MWGGSWLLLSLGVRGGQLDLRATAEAMLARLRGKQDSRPLSLDSSVATVRVVLPYGELACAPQSGVFPNVLTGDAHMTSPGIV